MNTFSHPSRYSATLRAKSQASDAVQCSINDNRRSHSWYYKRSADFAALSLRYLYTNDVRTGINSEGFDWSCKS